MGGIGVIFVGYFLVTLLLGLYEARKTKSQADFVLGGSKIPGWMLALSERATGESAWLLLGLSGEVFRNGLSAMWICAGCLAGICTAWIGLAGKFRAEAERYNALTMPEYFSAKFPRHAAVIRLVSTVIIVFFFVFYVAAQFAGAGKTIQQTFDIKPLYGQVASAVIIIAYASCGGFVSVVAVDVLQSILMIFTLVVAPVLMLQMVWSKGLSIWGAMTAAGPGLTSLTGAATGMAGGILIFNNLAWYFGYLGGQPQLNARFMGMSDERNVRIGRNIAVIWTVLAYAGVFLTGVCALTLFGPKVVSDPEMILPYAMTSLFPWWLAGILLAGAVAAMVSTAESMLLVAATSVSQDVCGGLLWKGGKLSDRTLLWISRVSTVVIGALGLYLALTSTDLIYTIVGYAWAGIGCSFAPAVLLAFFWPRFNGAGLTAALVTGLVTTIAWMYSGLEQQVTCRAVSFFVATFMAVVVTLVTPGEDPKGA